MRTLLIVDDEPNIVEGLASQFQQRYGDSVIVLKSFSGLHALSVLQNNKVDVVLSDISMPDLDGVSLAEKTEKLWPHIHFVFLSGFDDFDYIHRASKLPVYRGYLLKTEGDEVVLGKIDSELAQCEEETRAETQQNRMRAFLRRTALESTLRGGRSWQNFTAQMPDLSLEVDVKRPVVMVLGKSPAHGTGDCAQSLQLITDMISAQAPSLSCEALLPEEGTMTWLLQVRQEADDRDMGRYIYALFESIQQAADAYGAAVGFVVGGAVPFEKIVEQYVRLSSIYEMVARDTGRLIIVDERDYSELLLSREQDALPEAFRFSDFLHRLDRQLYSGTPETCRALFAEYFGQGVVLRSEQMLSVFTAVLSFLRENDLSASCGLRVSSLLDEYLRGGAQQKAQALNKRLAALCAELCAARAENQVHNTEDIINHINRYVDEHIEDYDLSLSELARMTGFNPSYLSRLYRLHTGRKLSEQIDEAKLKHAKALILSGKMVKNVAERTGFASPSAFILFFKRNTGKTPRQFYEENTGEDGKNISK